MIDSYTNPSCASGRLLSIGKVAELLDLSIKTVRRMIKRGELRVHRIGRQIRIAEDDFTVFLRHRRQ
ncbi:helix-turn-helix domain-containing protein [Neoroseomonas oryzicola]|uniref:Helix-turn-helix domain-containing protein n=1 Tax=Neoroseomonas oryzicola TaxID=535904 RepID=A0A9X9WPH6_9PROT|nr:helix-turn-helix domain-containing protein [Neoroseomonas oryzicola]NKE19758.1 helix-turn-helix domain-containing protein [Neoroseomonas oryzicola]